MKYASIVIGLMVTYSLLLMGYNADCCYTSDLDPEFNVAVNNNTPVFRSFDDTGKYYVFCNLFGIINYYNTNRNFNAITFNNRINDYLEKIEHADMA